ncbi:kinase-like domain-containing protein [Chiua virens]|nr:kinase-like domain-containing protein [Chiua virens]
MLDDHFLYLQVSVQQCWGVLHYSPFIFGFDLQLYYLLHEIIHALYQATGGDETGKQNIYLFWGVFRIHLANHAPAMVPERCANRAEILTDRIMKTQAYPVAHGGFSDVWCCLLSAPHKWLPPKRVAVKAIRPVNANDEEFQAKKKAVEQELKVWIELRHRNVLPLKWDAIRIPGKFDKQLGLKERLNLLSDVATGLQYLHSRNVVHGDLSGSNVLITSSGRACLSDFGLSTLVDVSDAVVTGVAYPGNIRWAAPELVEICAEGLPASQLQSRQADVYSFGSIMMQTLTGKLPFHGIRRVAEIVIMISRKQQPSREKRWDGRDIPEVLWNFVKTCWEIPDKRPSTDQIVGFITEQLSKL